jgi:hypothetical protein
MFGSPSMLEVAGQMSLFAVLTEAAFRLAGQQALETEKPNDTISRGEGSAVASRRRLDSSMAPDVVGGDREVHLYVHHDHDVTLRGDVTVRQPPGWRVRTGFLEVNGGFRGGRRRGGDD